MAHIRRENRLHTANFPPESHLFEAPGWFLFKKN